MSSQFLIILKFHSNRPPDLIHVILIGRRDMTARSLSSGILSLLPTRIHIAGGLPRADGMILLILAHHEPASDFGQIVFARGFMRSEERRVGKECRSWLLDDD